VYNFDSQSDTKFQPKFTPFIEQTETKKSDLSKEKDRSIDSNKPKAYEKMIPKLDLEKIRS
jgi:hypothetical protein